MRAPSAIMGAVVDHLQMTRRPELRRPVLVAAFRGWNDAGDAASGAALELRRLFRAERFADIDPEEFFDFQVNRPHVRWEGDRRVLEWPETTFAAAKLPEAERDVVVLVGSEPNNRWRTFTETILQLALDIGVSRVVLLGALQVDVPHSRPVPLTGSGSTTALEARFDLRRSGYEGPTGIVGVLHQACVAAGIEAVSLWAGVPHYLAGTSYLPGVLALSERALGVLEVERSLDRLARDAAAQKDDIAEVVAEDEDLAAYVEELEERADEDDDGELGDVVDVEERALPHPPVSGEELAAELERYLRDHHPEG